MTMISRRTFLMGSLALVSAFPLSACSGAQTQNATATIGSSTGASADPPSSIDLAYANEIDKSRIMSVEITADPAEWQNMLDNAIDKEYIPVDIAINGLMVENVGIKPKGNSSLSSVARDEDSVRYGFKVKFDKYVDDQTWLGLDKLVLNANWSDATSMKEYLSYDILNSIGVATPLFAYADIVVNGESWGFYIAIEVLDKGYLARTHNGVGELYKPDSSDIVGNAMAQDVAMPEGREIPDERAMPEGTGMPEGRTMPEGTGMLEGRTMPEGMETPDGMGMPDFSGDWSGNGMVGGGGMGADNGVALIYSDDNESSYASIFDNAETKTDEEDHRRVIEAIRNLNAGTDLEIYVDVDACLRYLAAHTVVVSLDSYEGSMGHNYYLYEYLGQIALLPWDYNMSFGGFQSGNASDVVNFPIDTPVSGVTMENRPLINQLFAVPEYLARYHGYMQQVVDGYFSNNAFSKRVDELDALISSHVKDDPSAFYEYDAYQKAIVELKKLGTLRAESVIGQLDGSIPSTSSGQQSDSSKLIDASSINMTALGDGGMGGFR